MNSTVSFYSSFSNNFVFFAVVLLLVYGAAFSINTTNAQLIPKEEVEILKVISHKLSIKYWRVSQGSCNDGGRSLNKTLAKDTFSNVTCDCSFNKSTVCHVTHIRLWGLNLSGVLPPEFGYLTELKELDLSKNYINGSIPTSLTKTPLVILALVVNRISGFIPEALGQISTLEELQLDDNQLGGHLPESLGNLKQLKRLLLSGNNFIGTIPASYVNLKNLTDFRIDGTTLSGKIPSFIGNWTELQKLELQGTNMEGPIPSAISSLKNLTKLKVSDLKGSSSTVISDLQLGELTKLERLTLRNCLLTGSIPDIIGDIKDLKILDLSFNRLTGTIPNNIRNCPLDNLFMSNNLLSGSIPDWIVSSKQPFDVSYNNFTGPISASCDQTNVNLVSCTSSTTGNANAWCSEKDLSCPGKPQNYAMFINCGGAKVNYEGHEYEEDLTPLGSSYFSSKNSWAYSSTGVFEGKSGNYIASNIYGLNVSGASYYQNARLSPSLKYYGLCLRKGSYKVQLHFAEIIFSNKQNFNSLGKRIFDVAIQGSVKLKNFNIAKEAGGVGKNVTKVFEDVYVNRSTLEIHLYWAGKGTNAVPNRGVYGPLISAITVTPNFRTDEALLSVGVIVGIVLACIAVLLGILVILRLKGCLGGTVNEQSEFRGLGTGYFSIRQIKAATNDFDPKNKIGEGGFGPVYKGILPDGRVIAVKQLSSKSNQGNREFVNEIGMISALRHPNLVKLYGCCIEKKELLLVYEYMENNCLGRAIFGCPEHRLNLDWPTRKNICLGIARGLAYLHTESRLKIVHRDIKASNVLLDKDLTAKISDFGLAKLDDEENSHISTRVAGTIGYMAPEYAMRGYLTDKADVYSYGVVVLEIISGKSNTNYRPKEEVVYLLDWAYVLQEQGKLLELVDPCLGTSYSEEEAIRLLNLSLLCTKPSPTLRPSMSLVLSMIEGSAPVQVPKTDFNDREDDEDLRFRAFEVKSFDGRSAYVEDSSSASYTQVQRTSSSASTTGPWINTS